MENLKNASKGVTVQRHINGIALNGTEFLLDDKGKLMVFGSIQKAKKFLQENGFGNYTEDDMEHNFIFSKVRVIED
jgi:hypothetical protein